MIAVSGQDQNPEGSRLKQLVIPRNLPETSNCQQEKHNPSGDYGIYPFEHAVSPGKIFDDSIGESPGLIILAA
jgi:hypothetical protein